MYNTYYPSGYDMQNYGMQSYEMDGYGMQSYGQTDTPKNYISIFIGLVILLINIVSLLSITVFCNQKFALRSISSKYYTWFVAFTSICLVIGIIGLVLNIIPPTKPFAMFIFPMSSSIISILVGAFATTYVAMTLAAINESEPKEGKSESAKCDTHQTPALQTICVSIIVGIVYSYLGFYPFPVEEDY